MKYLILVIVVLLYCSCQSKKNGINDELATPDWPVLVSEGDISYNPLEKELYISLSDSDIMLENGIEYYYYSKNNLIQGREKNEFRREVRNDRLKDTSVISMEFGSVLLDENITFRTR
jgi:hypothetical protein